MSLKGEVNSPIVVSICDDNKRHLDDIDTLVRKYFDDKSIVSRIVKYTTATDLLNSDVGVIDILFLDIQLGNAFGLDVGQKIRTINPKCLTILISSHGKYAPRGYEIKAFRYVPKEEQDTLVAKYLDDAMHELHIVRRTATLSFSKIGEYTFFVHRLVLVQNIAHKLVFRFFDNERDEAWMWDRKIDSVRKDLPRDCFIKINQSFLVNAEYVMSIKDLELNLIDEVFSLTKHRTLLISHKLVEEANQTFNRFKGVI